jgi:nucleoside-diphosphate-sugar epimerase
VDNGILLTGATGFVGSGVLRSLTPDERARTTVLVRSAVGVPPVGRTVVGDLRDPRALGRALDGVATVVHAASYVGYDTDLCTEVNVRGTRDVVDGATSRGVSRLVYLSTAAVLGAGPHRGAGTPQGPVSVLSASRRLAEQVVEAAGGLSVRPALVVGAGDRWVVPAIRRATLELGATIDQGRALKSVVHVDDLGALVAALSRRADASPPGSPPSVIAALPRPTSVSDLLALLVRHGLVDAMPTASLTLAEAEAALAPEGRELVRSVSRDYHLAPADAWDAAGLTPPEALAFTPRDVEHYRRLARA